MLRHLQAVFAAGILLAACAASALTVEKLVTEFRGGVYRVSFAAVLAAPPSRVGAVLQDYSAYPSLDARIRLSERLMIEPGGAVLLRTRIHACEGLFCRNVTRVERVEAGPGNLVATVIPALSQLRQGLTRTTWQALDAGTRVSYEAEFEPDFWVPAFIGRLFAGHGLRESTLELFANVERHARGE
jgi:Polyketide cyclase / dehydrase and lipid transport